MKKMVYNKCTEEKGTENGFGYVEMFHRSLLEMQAVLDGEITMLGQLSNSSKTEPKTLKDLPPRTKEEEIAMAWDESLSL